MCHRCVVSGEWPWQGLPTAGPEDAGPAWAVGGGARCPASAIPVTSRGGPAVMAVITAATTGECVAVVGTLWSP